MNKVRCSFAVLALVACSLASAIAQVAPKPAYLDTSLNAEQRAADLVRRMTLQEKASQMVNQARAIPRLGVSAYDWWSESLHGVAVNGTTEFPEPIGLAATFDAPAIHKMAVDISIEGRIKHVLAERAGHSNIMEGLDFWAPNINIFRDPRWGRGQETYGEDPFLTARMGVAFVTGMQGDDPHYFRVISTPKHYAVHSGPETTRHSANVDVSKHDELDTYLPAFRATVTEAKADSVMCAYNSINGQPACANQFLLEDQLRGKWGFKGYVVSDCGAVQNIYDGHHYEPTSMQADAISVQRGMDNECIDFRAKVNDDHDYKPYIDAVQNGYLKESELDTALVRLFTARVRLGMFDPPDMVPYSKIDEKELNSDEHRALARRLANESMVLLKNDGALPLKTSGIKIAVVGPLADQTHVLLGNYNGIPTHTVTVLEGIKKEFAADSVDYIQGTGFLSKQTWPVSADLLSIDGKPGARVTFLKRDIVSSEITPANEQKASAPLATRIDQSIDIDGLPMPHEVADVQPLEVRWETTLTPKETGDYNLGVETDGFVRVWLDGKRVTSANYPHGIESLTGIVHLEAGNPRQLVVEYDRAGSSVPHLHLVWAKINRGLDPHVVEEARKADVIVAVVGITSSLEGEEMQVNEPGFKGGDRTSLDLPQPEEDLLKSLATAGKPLVVVLTNGSALAVNWADQHANAILDAWYPGEEGGSAVAETLSGRNNPAGRLPVTFYTGVDQLPPFEDYSMKGRTYRYFEGTPLFPFGYGLSYTTFAYSRLSVPGKAVTAGDPVSVEATVTNTGKRTGDEVAQLYLSFPNVAGAPLRALRSFQRIHLDPGASQRVRFELRPRDLSMVSAEGEPLIPEGDFTISVGGGQPGTTAQVITGKLHIAGTKTLPE